MKQIGIIKKVGLSIFTLLFIIFSIGASHAGVFDNFDTWDYSVNQNPNDYTYDIIGMISRSYTTTTHEAGYSFLDVNGDGLVDVLYSEFTYRKSPDWDFIYKRTILFNKGNYQFDIGYKCAHVWEKPNIVPGVTPTGFYGDCAE